jgi:hypothetical protein
MLTASWHWRTCVLAESDPGCAPMVFQFTSLLCLKVPLQFPILMGTQAKVRVFICEAGMRSHEVQMGSWNWHDFLYTYIAEMCFPRVFIHPL